ncbi:hypothetical protein [Rhizobium leguminosarum]|uniref:hypothetical protein n=1 Tax=Rhizobium leguminosarum TaxID=384 RepID=UPI0016173BFD|nr:hypothetical protein [Rhizobium leguminosarum]MBB4331631.1 hypothetical protein [Rhizobium leguminosarum]MBB4357090.1 hypothetical protein [Rhizobium leguminosarum]MBB4551650.1 hypothetical protein [Rhizobium leguminosarum]MBB4564243.1 hypothetical protein [Rhizobium leguminosarum]
MKFFRPARSGECGRVRQLDVVDTLPFDQILHNLMFEIKARTVSKFQLDSAERRKTGAGLREMRRVFALQPAGACSTPFTKPASCIRRRIPVKSLNGSAPLAGKSVSMFDVSLVIEKVSPRRLPAATSQK